MAWPFALDEPGGLVSGQSELVDLEGELLPLMEGLERLHNPQRHQQSPLLNSQALHSVLNLLGELLLHF